MLHSVPRQPGNAPCMPPRLHGHCKQPPCKAPTLLQTKAHRLLYDFLGRRKWWGIIRRSYEPAVAVEPSVGVSPTAISQPPALNGDALGSHVPFASLIPRGEAKMLLCGPHTRHGPELRSRSIINNEHTTPISYSTDTTTAATRSARSRRQSNLPQHATSPATGAPLLQHHPMLQTT
jgi:hypothetical protein